MQPGDRVYGIDASRSSVIQSYSNQHRQQVVEQGSLKRSFPVRSAKGGAGTATEHSPLAINPLNDSWLAGEKGLPQLETSRSKNFRREYGRYKSFLETIPEVRQMRQEARAAAKSGIDVRKDTDARRRTFGTLSKAGINFAHQERSHIFYTLDNMTLEHAFDPSQPHYPTVSSQEVRHIYANRGELVHREDADSPRNTVRFIQGSAFVAPSTVFRQVTNAPALARRPSFSELPTRPRPASPGGSGAAAAAVAHSPSASDGKSPVSSRSPSPTPSV